MTGGSLPAMAWKEIMQFAHQGLELKPIPGVTPATDPKAMTIARAGSPETSRVAQVSGPGAGHMPRQSFEVLSAVGSMFKTIEASRTRGTSIQVGIREVSSPGRETRLR
jgi:penicillin-binding protein 1A